MHVWCNSDNVPHSGIMSSVEIRWRVKETTHCWWRIRGLAEFLRHVICIQQQQWLLRWSSISCNQLTNGFHSVVVLRWMGSNTGTAVAAVGPCWLAVVRVSTDQPVQIPSRRSLMVSLVTFEEPSPTVGDVEILACLTEVEGSYVHLIYAVVIMAGWWLSGKYGVVVATIAFYLFFCSLLYYVQVTAM